MSRHVALFACLPETTDSANNPKVAGSNPAPPVKSPGQWTAGQGFYRFGVFFSRVSTGSSNAPTRAFVTPMTFGFLVL